MKKKLVSDDPLVYNYKGPQFCGGNMLELRKPIKNEMY